MINQDRGQLNQSVNTRFILIALILVGFNLRTALSSLPPLVDEIQRLTGIDSLGMGLLTTLPVLLMGLVAPFVPRLVYHQGIHTTIAWALLSLTLGLVGRFWGDIPAILYLTTAIAGLGIAILGAVLPRLVREHFSSRVGAVTGLYTGAMALGATIASGVSVPMRNLFASWELSLTFWAIPAFIAFCFWIPIYIASKKRKAEGDLTRVSLPWKNRVAWLVTAYVTIQSLLFFCELAWISPAYVSHGHTPLDAGFLFSIYSVAGFVATISVPALSDRIKDQRYLMTSSISCAVIGFSLFTFFPAFTPWLVMIVFGFGQTAAFSLGLVLLAASAPHPRIAGQLTAMAFLFAYTIAAIGPALVGALIDLTHGYSIPFTLLILVNLCSLVLSFYLKPELRVE